MNNLILVVQNDEPMCFLVKEILRGYNVKIFRDGLEAVSWLSEGNQPQLIISDFRMQHMDGIDLLRNLKKSGLYKHIPILILSGHLSDENKMDCMDLGAQAIVQKPFKPEDLMEAVNNSLDHREMSYA